MNKNIKNQHKKSFHKGWFIPNEVLQRIFFTWPAKTVFVPKKWPSAYQVIMCKINSPRGLRRDIP